MKKRVCVYYSTANVSQLQHIEGTVRGMLDSLALTDARVATTDMLQMRQPQSGWMESSTRRLLHASGD